LSRIACIFAHPDDETFCVGGIVAKYASEDARIDLFCATNGDAGKAAGVLVSSRDELAALRHDEIHAACRILGIATVEMPGYPDGELAQSDAAKLIGDMVSFIRRTKPDVVITFGPEGAPTGHRDHCAISRAATAAYFLSGLKTAYADQLLEPYSAKRLFYHAWAYPLADPRLKLESVPATCEIDVRAFKAKKEQAFRAHVTQQGSSQAFYGAAFNDVERLAFAAGVPQPRAMIEDVFEGL
jgi:LmbE family N-acetylglucosaminyl deacetylase